MRKDGIFSFINKQWKLLRASAASSLRDRKCVCGGGEGVCGVPADHPCLWTRNSWSRIAGLTEEELSSIEGIGAVMAKAYVEFFAKPDNIKMMEDLLSVLTIDESFEEAADTLAGKTFVITGSLEHFENRDAAKARIEELGGKTAGSVSSKTDYLINNDINSGSGKNKKAKELGVPIITEEEFLEMIK